MASGCFSAVSQVVALVGEFSKFSRFFGGYFKGFAVSAWKIFCRWCTIDVIGGTFLWYDGMFCGVFAGLLLTF